MADAEKAVVVEEQEEASSEEEEGGTKRTNTASILSDPTVMAAMQSQLGRMVGQPSGYVQSLPAPVRRRIKALKKLQLEATKIEAKFYEEVHALECKYHKLYTPIYTRRGSITRGEHEPTDQEAEWPSEDEDDEEENKPEKKEETAEEKAAGEAVQGVPAFWLTILKNVEMLAEMVQDADEPVLETLTDVTVEFSKPEETMGFTLNFHFAKNEYFSNNLLTKKYLMRCEPEEEDPFSFEGPEIYKCSGSSIDWLAGKNLTVKQVKKKQKHKSKGSVRTVTKQVKADSFFNFFSPPAVPDDPTAEVDEDTQDLLTADFEIGHYIRERVVPRAVLFFTGEALEDEESEDEDSDEDGDEDEEDDSENDADFDPSKEKANPECKQQ